MPASTRFQPLDGIRFFAFIPVFYLHACGGGFFYHLALTSLDLFFLLSGFLTGFGRLKDFLVVEHNRFNVNGLCDTPPICREREGNFHLGKYSCSYMWKKILTFYPWHVVCLVWSVCIFCQAPSHAGYMPEGGEEWAWKMLAYLLLIQSWWVEPEVKFCFNGVSWFLASLMFCYAVSPLLLKMVARGLCRRGCAFLLFMLAGALVLKALPYLFEQDGSLSHDFTALYDRNIHSWPPLRLLDYMVGMTAGIWYALRPKPQGEKSLTASVRLVIQGILLVGIVGVSLYCPGPLALLLCVIWIYCLVLWHDGFVSKILGAPLLVFLGGLVMPVYLTHNLVLKSLRALKMAPAGLVQASVVFIFCFLFAWCLMQLCRWIRKRYTS